MVMTGVGCGLTIGSVNVQARFTHSQERVAIISALILFVSFRRKQLENIAEITQSFGLLGVLLD